MEPSPCRSLPLWRTVAAVSACAVLGLTPILAAAQTATPAPPGQAPTGATAPAAPQAAAQQDGDDEVDALIQEALSHLNVGEWDKAIDALMDALDELDEDNEDEPIVLYLLGRAHHEKGDLKEAIDYYLDALEADPAYAAARMALARAYLDNENFAEASELLSELVEQLPNDSGLWTSLALAQANAGEIEPAFDSAIKAVELNPFNVDAHLLLALFLDLARQAAAALRQYQLILDLTRDEGIVQRVQQRIAQLDALP